MKARGIRLPLWLQIILCPIGIGLIGFLLVICFGKSWFPSLAYLVAATAIAVGVCVAYHHLRIIQGIEKAHVLTHLDACWAYTELAKSRAEILKFRNELESTQGSREWHDEIKNKLRSCKTNKYDTYKQLINMVDFYETLGYFSKVRYISTTDALELYAPSIKDYDEIFRSHILELQQEKQDLSLYENFIWLADELKKNCN